MSGVENLPDELDAHRGEFELGDDAPVEGRIPPECQKYVEFDKTRSVFGRLNTPSALRFWRSLTSMTLTILTWIMVGFSLPWINGVPCPPARFANQKSCYGLSAFGEKELFIDKAISALHMTGAIGSCESSFLKVVSPLGVAEQRDKLRLILNMRYVNSHLTYPSFRFESLRDLADIMHPDDWLFSIDLMNAYHHLGIHEKDWPYMGFSWRGKYYYFKVVAFGLGPAPWVFSKTVGVLNSKWRSQGIHTLPYLDDVLGGGLQDVARGDPRGVLYARDVMLHDLQQAGFLVSASKAKLTPCTVITHLGMVVNMRLGSFRVPLNRMQDLKALVKPVLEAGVATARVLARITGKAESFRLAMGSVVKLYTRHLHFLIDEGQYWDSKLVLTTEVQWALTKWMGIECGDFMLPIFPETIRFSVELDSDAGDRGWGAVLYTTPEPLEARGYLTPAQRCRSSTWRELFAIHQSLLCFREFFKYGMILRWNSDSACAMWNLYKGGSKVLELHTLCVLILQLCIQLGIEVLWTWIPRELNEWADWLAGMFDPDDWMLNGGVFQKLDRLWGRHTIDRFGSNLNALCAAFNSDRWCPGTGGIDAFTQRDWLRQNNWCNPPFYLIGRLLELLKRWGATATLIVPYWPGRPWWTKLCPDGRHFGDFVIDWRGLMATPNLFSSGFQSGNTTGHKLPGYRFFALRVSFSPDALNVSRTTCTQGGDCDCGQPMPLQIRANSWVRGV